MRLRAAFALMGVYLLSGPALAQGTPATVYCVNDRILVERSTIPQIQTRFANRATICIIGPSFDFQPDGVTWVRNNLRAAPGDRCSCR
ncbi:hypothetical protein [Falsiroseomonas oryziterrae]|uniref:hypothetical protein n=1 Tax=Falsiroseomonas oryziterrae TaxID=2911368 RepID=UPI001F274AFF|nr:hypothetical protein [Roseomonas sp. NPKOSM-4]